jgi:phosphohistidine phosphatase SixA
MKLYLVRHAEAVSGAPEDESRRLTEEGREQARELARRLAGEGVRPAAILSSPLVRARETAEILGRELGVDPAVEDRLRPGATAGRVREAVEGRGEVVIAVGHQPDCGEIAAELTGSQPDRIPAASAIEIRL